LFRKPRLYHSGNAELEED